MDFIIGGAYQGKCAYAKQRFSLSDEQIFSCTEEGALSFDLPCVEKLEEFALWCVRNQEDAAAFFQARKEEWRDSVLLCRDIFCGVVPIDAEMRAWREMTGRLCAYLAGEAESVTRLFCGLPQKLK